MVYFLMAVFAKFLPKKAPIYNKLKDDDYISILSWLEDWEPEQVYKTAYKQSHIDYIQTWDEWSDDMSPLPLVVRMELQRAIQIHEERGNLMALRGFAWFYDCFTWIGKSTMWIFFIFVAYYWFFT
jgi:hypothetical protein